MVQVYIKLRLFKNKWDFSGGVSSSLVFAIIVCNLFFITAVFSQESEVERLKGFKKFKIDSQIYDFERVKGYSAYLESLEKDAFDERKALQEYRKIKKTEKPLEETKFYQQYLREKYEEQKNDEEDMADFKKEKKKWTAKEFKRPFTEDFELGLNNDRPRYDYKKRALYGAKPKYKNSVSAGSGGYSPTTDPVRDNFMPPFSPPPPPPPPPISEPFYDEIPPPPPMPMDGMGDFNNDGFIPPPPPPPMFDGEF